MLTKFDKFLKAFDNNATVKSYRWTLGTFIKSVYGENTVVPKKGEKIDKSRYTAKRFEQYFSENRNIEEDLLSFQTFLNGRAPLTTRAMNSSIRTFLSENDIEFPAKFWKKISKRRKGKRAITLDEIPEDDQLRQIFTHMSTKGKSFYLILASSGMRFGELLKIELSDIDLKTVPTKINIQAKYTKTGTSRYAFISTEATEVLKEWLKIHEESLVTLTNRSTPERQKLINRNRLFPFESCTARIMWNNALKKAKLDKRDGSTKIHVFHPHVLRKYFRTRMATEIPVDIVEALIGHEGYLTEVYRKHTIKDLGKFYAKGEHIVTIFGHTGELTKIKTELEGRNTTFQKWFIEVKGENDKLKKQVEQFHKELKNAIRRIDELESKEPILTKEEKKEILNKVDKDKVFSKKRADEIMKMPDKDQT